jgi:hypothetical protein
MSKVSCSKKRVSLCVRLAVVLMLAFGAAPSHWWVAPVAAQSGAMPPFRAVIQTVPVPTGSCGPGCISFEISGTGQATHMGTIECAGPSQVIVPFGQQTGTSTLTGANGDTIVIAFAGTVNLEGPNPTDPVSFQGEWDVIAGTGRFDGANGSGTYSGTAAGPSGDLLLIGHLSNPGGNK